MNSNLYGNVFPGTPLYSGGGNVPNQSYTDLPMEQSYIENILRLNKGKNARIHMTFPDSNEFRDREFSGIIEQSGRDHIILRDPKSGTWELLLMIYVDFITFDEKINYSESFVPNN